MLNVHTMLFDMRLKTSQLTTATSVPSSNLADARSKLDDKA